MHIRNFLKRHCNSIVCIFILLAFSIPVIPQQKAAEQSLVSDKHLYQMDKVPTLTAGITRFKIADNLAIDIKGVYPDGVNPRWNYIGPGNYSGWPIKLRMEGFLAAKPVYHDQTVNIYIRPNKTTGKAVLVVNENVYGDLDIKDMAVIVSGKQTFKVPYFKKIVRGVYTEEKVEGGFNYQVAGGMAAEVGLSVDDVGDITMDLMIEYYRTATRFTGAGVSTRFYGYDLPVKNQMTVDMYFRIRRSDSIWTETLKQMEKQKQDEFEAQIKDSYKKVLLAQSAYGNLNTSCLKDTSASFWVTETQAVTKDVYYTDPVHGFIASQPKTVYEPVSVFRSFQGVVNTCSKTIAILGIEKNISERGTVYYIDKTIVLEPGQIATGIYLSYIKNVYNATSAPEGRQFYKTKLK